METCKLKLNPHEIPFLVTRWLYNFQPTEDSVALNADAIRRIRNAAGELATAFADLGVFGTKNMPQLETRRTAELPCNRASYEDILRKYNHTPPNQLELALESVASMDKSTWGELPPPNNLFHVAQEMQYSHGSGKRLGETVDLTKENVSIDLQDFNICSILHPMPLLHRKQEDSNSDPYSEILPYQGPEPSKADSQKSLSLSVLSDFEALGKATGEAVRSFLCSREELRRIEEEIAVLQQNILKHEELQSKTEMKRQRIIFNSQETHKSSLQSSGIEVMAPDELMQQEILDSSRVIAQMRNKVFQHTQKLEGIKEQVVKAEKTMRQLCKTSKDNFLHFRDPFQTRKFHSLSCSLTDSGLRSRFQLLDLLSTRQVGISSFRTAKQIGVPICVLEAKETRKSILSSRFAHSVTINAHLSFPIYCLQFDKTGRYFITGADDSLVKLFCLGAAQSRSCSKSKKSLTFTYGANGHGAILVCTLRGHAGVICDIDVSSDNSLVATASDDGDVRVWGLKDGCPVAILRGHKGGANMVSWSKITPYRLVSVGMDGLARIWDVREAALKRYGSLIGNRMEYTLPLLESEKQALEFEMEKRHRHLTENNCGNQANSLPSERSRESEGSLSLVDPAALVALPEPILGDNRQEIFEEGIFDEVSVPSIDGNLGAFRANDNLDEGVKIIARLKHGDSIQSSGPGTRSRLKQVKVICVARCPIGGHFATGSDDGLCRIWEDEDDEVLALIDCRDGSPSKMRNVPIENSTVPSTEKLLTTLVGHMSSITDLHYSNAGDRIVTASQKDGIARIWSFGSSLSSRQPLRQTLRHCFLEQKQIVLRLNTVNTTGQVFVHNRQSRRKIGSSDCIPQSAVTCDVAVWNSDDTKIITSQSAPAKGNRQDIIPGSQLLLVWDSFSGNCLIAIKHAHSQQCPVVVSHPLHASIICSAGADGFVKLWDLETGKCLFHHKNTNSPISISHTNEQSKQSGYLDGRFDPNGEYLLLTDDSGQISIFDCLAAPGDENRPTVPLWMSEQYFANDYYELIYDSNGYCIERGSEKPPHLAPRAVRCNHAGVAWAIDISETFRHVRGPSPVSVDVAMSERKVLRYKLQEFCARVNYLKRATIMTNFDPERTIQIYGTSDILKPNLQESNGSSIRDHNSQQSDLNRRQNASRARSLSNNYRWRDYDDVIREEVANDAVDPDVEDEDFIPRGLVEDDDDDELSNSTGSDSLHQSYNDHQEENRRLTRRGTPRSQRANRRENHRQRDIIIPPASRSHASRMSSRHRRDGSESPDEDEDLFDEILSTNNYPSGPYIDDYNADGHLFKLPNANNKVNRAWLLRNESISSYKGRKVYVPQAGDSVVYIPRAHAETIRAFPALKAPWKEWPSDMKWPIVRCRIRNLRYRFPFKEYYKRSREEKCTSIVVILTLEVTGLPDWCLDREFPWPKPSFTKPNFQPKRVFEVSLFESKNAEHIIPEELFMWRLCSLENVLKQRANDPTGLKIIASYIPHENEEDPAFIEYEAEVIEYAPCDEKSDENVKKSGFECLVVSWGDDNELLSPWEVTIPDPTLRSPGPLPLSSAEKRAVLNTLRIIESNEKFKAFTSPVNTLRYPDYLARVEVPMDTSKVRTRLEADFYVSLLSVLSDVKLIRENCKKYNGLDEMASLATELFNTFKDLMKGELDRLGVDYESTLEIEEDMDCTETRSSMNSSNAKNLDHLSTSRNSAVLQNSFTSSANADTESIDNGNERQNGNPVNLLSKYSNGDESGKLDVSIANDQLGQGSRFYESSTFTANKKHRTMDNETEALDGCKTLEDTSDSEGESYHEEIQNERKPKRIHRSKRRSSSMTRSVLELNTEFDSSHSKFPRSRRSKNSSEVLSALVSSPTEDVKPLRTRNDAKQSNLSENKEKAFDEGVVSRRPKPCVNRFEEVGEYKKQSAEKNGDERLNLSPIKRERSLEIKAGLLDYKSPRRLSSRRVGSKPYKDDVHDNDSEILIAESYHRGQRKSLQKEEVSTKFGEIAEKELENKTRLRPTRACTHLNNVHDDQSKPEIQLKQSPIRKSSRHQVVKSEERLSDSYCRDTQTKRKYKEDTSEEEWEGNKSATPKVTRQSSRKRRLCKTQNQTNDDEDEKHPKELRRKVLTYSKSKHAASSDESETFSDTSLKPRRRNPSRGQKITSFQENDETSASEEDDLASQNEILPRKDRPRNYKAEDDQTKTVHLDRSYRLNRRTRGRGRDRSVSTLAMTTKECESFQDSQLDSSSNSSDYASETSPDESEHNGIEDIPCKKVSLSRLPKVPNELVLQDFKSEYSKERENNGGEIVDTSFRSLRPRGTSKILIEAASLSEINEIQGNLKIEEKHEVALSYDKPRRGRSNRSPMHIGNCDLEGIKENSLDDHKSRLRTRKRHSVEVVSNNAESNNEIKTFRKKSRNEGFKACMPERSRWPKVPLRKISLIAKSILSELRKLDTEGNFNGPVTDLFPEIRDSYLSVISTPMDFTTIESEMLPNFESIFEFEENLILVFENCIQFNGSNNPFGLFAISMLEQLNDIFQRVCHENGVRLPGNWNQH